jgi:hypothetical protein
VVPVSTPAARKLEKTQAIAKASLKDAAHAEIPRDLLEAIRLSGACLLVDHGSPVGVALEWGLYVEMIGRGGRPRWADPRSTCLALRQLTHTSVTRAIF